jgi:hypothetical protein
MEDFATAKPLITEPEDGGAIIVNSITVETNGSATFSLSLKPEVCLEACGTFKQWFNFQVSNLPTNGATHTFIIEDAGESTFSDWQGFNVCSTTNMVDWERIQSTSFKDGKLIWSLAGNKSACIQFAYFPTYSLEAQEKLVRDTVATGHATHKVLGTSVDGRPLHALVFSKNRASTPEKRVVWIQHRQHPGETSASWFCDGVISRLLELSNAPSSKLLDSCLIVVVPNVNPDGGVRGHLRTNASGANLNRCWGGLHGMTALGQSDPKAPEVEAMIKGMQSLGGPDVMLDIHQDEEKPC